MTQDALNNYVYDPEGRLCTVENIHVGTMTQYVYDAEGRRIAKGTPGSWPAAGPTCAAPTAANGFTLTATYLKSAVGGQDTEIFAALVGTANTNVYAGGGLLATYSFARMLVGGTFESVLNLSFNFNDWLGTKRLQVNSAGQVINHWGSEPFGDYLTPHVSGNDATNQHFTGKERDTESGNDYFGARYYASSMGRFMSPDPSGLYYADPTNPQSFNLYAYGLNNPLRLVDPNGLEACDWGPSDNGGEDIDDEDDCASDGGTPITDQQSITVTPQPSDPPPSCSGFTGAMAPPSGPINYRQQAQSNSQQTWWGWYQDFKGGGTQDFKGNSAYGNVDQQRAAGNFTFGASVAAKGWSLQTAQALAGEGAYLTNVKGQLSWSMGQSAYMNGQYGGPTPPANNPPPPDWNVGPGTPGSPAYAANSGLMNQGDQDASYENQSVALGYVWYSLGCTQ